MANPTTWEDIRKTIAEEEAAERAQQAVLPPDPTKYEVQEQVAVEPPRNLVGSPSDPDTLYSSPLPGPTPQVEPSRLRNIADMRNYIYYGTKESREAGARLLREQETNTLLEELKLSQPAIYESLMEDITPGEESALMDAYHQLPPGAQALVDGRVGNRLPYYLASREEVKGRSPFSMVDASSNTLDVASARAALRQAVADWMYQEDFGRQPAADSWEYLRTRKPEAYAEFMAEVDRRTEAEWTTISAAMLNSGILFTNQSGATEAILAGETAPGGAIPWSSLPKAITTSAPVMAGRALMNPVDTVVSDLRGDQIQYENPIISALRPLSMGTAFLAAPLVSDIREADKEKPEGGEVIGSLAKMASLATGPLYPATVWARFLGGEDFDFDLAVDVLPAAVIIEGIAETVPFLYNELGKEESIRWLRESGDITTAIPEITALAEGAMVEAGYPEEVAKLVAGWAAPTLTWTMAIGEPDYAGVVLGTAARGAQAAANISEARKMESVAKVLDELYPTNMTTPTPVEIPESYPGYTTGGFPGEDVVRTEVHMDIGDQLDRIKEVDPRAAVLLEMEISATLGSLAPKMEGSPKFHSASSAGMSLQGTAAMAVKDTLEGGQVHADDILKEYYNTIHFNQDPETGMILGLKSLDEIVELALAKRLDDLRVTNPAAADQLIRDGLHPSQAHRVWDRTLRREMYDLNLDDQEYLISDAVDNGLKIDGAGEAYRKSQEHFDDFMQEVPAKDRATASKILDDIQDDIPRLSALNKELAAVDTAWKTVVPVPGWTDADLKLNPEKRQEALDFLEQAVKDPYNVDIYETRKAENPLHPDVARYEQQEIARQQLSIYDDVATPKTQELLDRVVIKKRLATDQAYLDGLRTKRIPRGPKGKPLPNHVWRSRLLKAKAWRKSAQRRLQKNMDRIHVVTSANAAINNVGRAWSESLRGAALAARRRAKGTKVVPKAEIKATNEIFESPPGAPPPLARDYTPQPRGPREVRVSALREMLEATPLGKTLLAELDSGRPTKAVEDILSRHPLVTRVLQGGGIHPSPTLSIPEQLELLQELDSLQTLNVLEGMRIDGSLRAESFRRILNSYTPLDRHWQFEPWLALRRMMKGDPHFQSRLGDLKPQAYEALRVAENSYHQTLSEMFELGITPMTKERQEVVEAVYLDHNGKPRVPPGDGLGLPPEITLYLQTLNVLLSTNIRVPLGVMPTVSNIGRSSLWDKARAVMRRNVHSPASQMAAVPTTGIEAEILDLEKKLQDATTANRAQEVVELSKKLRTAKRELDDMVRKETTYTEPMPIYLEAMAWSFIHPNVRARYRGSKAFTTLVHALREEAIISGDLQTFVERGMQLLNKEDQAQLLDIWEGVARSTAMAASEYDMLESFRRAVVGGFTAEEAVALDRVMGSEWTGITLGAGGVQGIDFERVLVAAEKLGIPLTNQIHKTANEAQGKLNRIIALAESGEGAHTDWFVLGSLIAEFEQNYGSLIKQLRGDPTTSSGMVYAARKLFSDYVGLSMRSMVLGILYINPRNLVNSLTGDWSQIVRARGWVDGTAISFASLPSNFMPPSVHRRAERYLATEGLAGAKKLGASDSGVWNAVLNPRMAQFYNDPEMVIATRGGPDIPADTIWLWAKEDGILESFGDALQIRDMAQAAQAEGQFQKLAAWWATHNYKIADFANYIQQRRRMALYLEVLVETGGNRQAAKEAVYEALYDWKHGAPQEVLRVAGMFMPFVRWRFLEHYNLKKMLLEPLTMSPSEWTLRSLVWNTKMGRVQKLAEIQARGFKLALDENATEDEEREWLASMFRPRWLMSRFTIYGESADAYGREWYRKRGREVEALNWVTPSFSPVDQAMLTWACAALVGGTMTTLLYRGTGEVPPLAYNWQERPLGMVLESLYPFYDTGISAVLSNYGMGTDAARAVEWKQISPEISQLLPEAMLRETPAGAMTYPAAVAGMLSFIPGFGPQIWVPAQQMVSPEWTRRDVIGVEPHTGEPVFGEQLPLYERVFRGTIDAVAKITKIVPARYYTSPRQEIEGRVLDSQKALKYTLSRYDRTALEDAQMKAIYRQEPAPPEEKK